MRITPAVTRLARAWGSATAGPRAAPSACPWSELHRPGGQQVPSPTPTLTSLGLAAPTAQNISLLGSCACQPSISRSFASGEGPRKHQPIGIPNAANVSPALPTQHPGADGWSAVPPGCKALGLAGVIPFVVLSPPVASVIPLMPIEVVLNAAALQTSYGICIATFLGGVHWGMAMAEYGGRALSAKAAVERYFWSVTPSLIVFPVVTLPPLGSSLVITATLFAAYMVDRSFTAKGLLPKWYMALRLPLTVGATSGMLMTAYHFSYLVPS